MTVRIVNKSKNPLPKYQTTGSSGVDMYADIEVPMQITAGQPVAVPTGLFVEIPHGYEAQIRSRSGLALKEGVFCLNSPGTIDSDYRGEIKVIIANTKDTPFTVKPGDRIAQMVFTKVEIAAFEQVSSLGDTERGHGGFGSTGK
ncbi:MAG: dUTP diphosphatase [Spirochaetes bacterium]|nr:dUTP diphosphatase [Spirochaetota bacterium]